MKFLKISCYIIISLLTSNASANGIVNHVDIAQRALHLYSLEQTNPHLELILNNQDAFQAGATFPDWGFAPNISSKDKQINHNAGEAAHWGEFYMAATKYIRQKPKPWLHETEQLIAFILGAMSHSVADLYWHNLRCSRESIGFLEAMSHRDFSSNYNLIGYDKKPEFPIEDPKEAHSIGDYGSNFISVMQTKPTWISSNLFYPINDLVNIYSILSEDSGTDYKVNANQLKNGFSLMATMVKSLSHVDNSATLKRLLIKPSYNYSSKRSPFLLNLFNSYYSGGMDSNALLTAISWPKLMVLLENVPTKKPSTDSDLFCPKNTKSKITIRSDHNFRSLNLENNALSYSTLNDGILFKLDNDNRNISTSGKTNKLAYSYRGHSIESRTTLAISQRGDFNLDGKADVIIGLPGYSSRNNLQSGAVFINSVDSLNEQDFTLLPPKNHGRFGTSIAVLDFDLDGYDDLAVGAPTTGFESLSFRGEVMIFKGSDKGLSTTPFITLTGQMNNTNFGWHLNALDLNNDGHKDLVIGSPFAGVIKNEKMKSHAGSVSVYLSLTSNRAASIPNPTWVLEGENATDWFGYSTASLKLNDGKTRLLIAAPGLKNTIAEKQSVGALYGYDLVDDSHATEAFKIKGEQRNAMFGSSIAAGMIDEQPVIAVSAPNWSSQSSETKPHSGKVWLLKASDLIGHKTINSFSSFAELVGENTLARFGWKVSLQDIDGDAKDDVTISEPLKGVGAEFNNGAIYSWLSRKNLPRGNLTASSAGFKYSSTIDRSQFGYNFSVVGDKTNKEIIVSAPLTPVLGRPSGNIVKILIK